MTKITLKMVLMLGVLAVLVVSVAGCTSNNSTNTSTGGYGADVAHSSMDYSKYYDNTTTASIGILLTKPFSKTTSVRGNDLYVGQNVMVVSPSIIYTEYHEHFNTKDDAAAAYHYNINLAKAGGYVTTAGPSVFKNVTWYWEGIQGAGLTEDCDYYNVTLPANPAVTGGPTVNVWVVNTEIAGYK